MQVNGKNGTSVCSRPSDAASPRTGSCCTQTFEENRSGSRSLGDRGGLKPWAAGGRTVHEGDGGEEVVLHLQVEAAGEEVANDAAPVGRRQHLPATAHQASRATELNAMSTG